MVTNRIEPRAPASVDARLRTIRAEEEAWPAPCKDAIIPFEPLVMEPTINRLEHARE
jgi:hypothetical protein